VSNEHGSLQAWSHDLDTGERRRLSDEHVGVEEALVTPDGSRVAWWQDATGNEHGRWVAAPFEGGEPAPFVAGVPDAWNMGMDAVGEVTAVGLSLDDGTYAVHIETGGRPARELYRHERPAGVAIEWESGRGGLSADASLVCVRHAERGDIEHYALRALETWSGATAGEQWDQGLNLLPGAWSPVAGDQRLVIRHEREGYERPAIWDLAGGKRRDLAVDLPGAVEPLGWWPDASAILVLHDVTAARKTEQMRADFVSNVSHELRSPLSSLLGFIETLRGPRARRWSETSPKRVSHGAARWARSCKSAWRCW